MIDNAIKEFIVEKYDPTTVVGEFSGRDSVAAIMKAFECDDINYILPIATFSGTEYGDYNVIYNNYLETLAYVNKKYGNKKKLYPLVEYNRSDIWHMMNGRVATQLNRKYSFYNPCIGCHLYFHLTKLTFASQLSKRIISGERESHDGKIKVNQLFECLETYKGILTKLGFELLMPLQNIKRGEDVQSLIGWEWREGEEHPKCVFSGNYRDAEGKAIYDSQLIHEFLQSYIEPIGLVVGDYLLENISNDDLKEKMKDII